MRVHLSLDTTVYNLCLTVIKQYWFEKNFISVSYAFKSFIFRKNILVSSYPYQIV